jgi:magnesium transporter
MSDILNGAEELHAPAEIASTLSNERPADIVEALNGLDPERSAAVLIDMPPERVIEVFDLPGLEGAAEIVRNFPIERVPPLLAGMSADRVADIFRDLDEPVRNAILPRLDLETQDSLRRLLSYPERSVGSIMTTEFVSVPANWTVGRTLDHIRQVERTRETVYSIYILDPVKKRLVQAATLRRLRRSDEPRGLGGAETAADHGLAPCRSRGGRAAHIQI